MLLGDQLLEAERAAALYSEAAAALDELGIRDEAAAAYRAVLDRTPNDGAAFKRARVLLGSLYGDNQDPEFNACCSPACPSMDEAPCRILPTTTSTTKMPTTTTPTTTTGTTTSLPIV